MNNMSSAKELMLESTRLIMRPPTSKDADDIFAYASDSNITKYLLFAPHKSLEDTIEFIRLSEKQWEKREARTFVILSKTDGRLIGVTGLTFDCDSKDTARIGYVLAKDKWGKGYATEACMRIIDYAKEIGVRRLVAPMHPDNIASIRVLEKCGFQEDSDASETYFLPNLNEQVKHVGLSRSLSMSTPPPDLIWDG
jgi:ribosomal-protein-alanine N-acetyltransferase